MKKKYVFVFALYLYCINYFGRQLFHFVLSFFICLLIINEGSLSKKKFRHFLFFNVSLSSSEHV